jgi:hypothetical protein
MACQVSCQRERRTPSVPRPAAQTQRQNDGTLTGEACARSAHLVQLARASHADRPVWAHPPRDCPVRCVTGRDGFMVSWRPGCGRRSGYECVEDGFPGVDPPAGVGFASGNPTATCTNPAGATQPPGQNPAEVDLTGPTAVPAGDVKNGNVTITTRTDAPVTPIPGAPDCPNPQWTENITDMAFTSATISLFQDANANGTFDDSELVLTVNCTFSPPTSNGSVPPSGSLARPPS